MSSKQITSKDNPHVKEAVALRERRERDRSSLFLIEGYRELKRAVDAKRKIDRLFYCPAFFLGENEQALLDRSGGALIECSKEVFAKISYRDRPDGLLAIAPQLHLSLQDLKLSKNPFLLIAERIEKPGNLGTILRSSDAVGVDAVIVSDPTTDIHNPNVVRASVGTLFTVPVIEAEGEEVLRFLKEQKISICSATPKAKLDYTEAGLSGPIAIAVGAEQIGLSQKWLDEADIQVSIPMLGVADSLNVASATTLLLYEVLRQRKLSR
jgi:TrmH family RNA methyltransferase